MFSDNVISGRREETREGIFFFWQTVLFISWELLKAVQVLGNVEAMGSRDGSTGRVQVMLSEVHDECN